MPEGSMYLSLILRGGLLKQGFCFAGGFLLGYLGAISRYKGNRERGHRPL